MAQQLKLVTTTSNNHIGKRLDQTLTEIFPQYSRSCIQKWIRHQMVYINGNVINKTKKKILGGEIITICTKINDTNHFKPQNIPLDVIYEDNDIIIVNKQTNLVVHPGAGNHDGTMLNALLNYYPSIINVPRAGIVHRLDKNTTGLMVVAKTSIAYTNLVKLLKFHQITREYEGIVIGCMKLDGTINQPIKRHLTKRTCMSVHPAGKPSITHYHIVECFRMHTRLRLRLETGRTHQIRVHMSYINHPLVGDHCYGGLCKFITKDVSNILISTLNKFNRQALHAVRLNFNHPISGIQMEWHSPIPQDMIELINAMRIDLKNQV